MPRDNFFLGGEEGDGQAANRRRAEGGGAYAGRVRKRGRGRSNDRQREKRAFCVYVVLEALACLSTRLYAAVFVRAYSKRIGVSVSVCMCNVPPPLPHRSCPPPPTTPIPQPPCPRLSTPHALVPGPRPQTSSIPPIPHLRLAAWCSCAGLGTASVLVTTARSWPSSSWSPSVRRLFAR